MSPSQESGAEPIYVSIADVAEETRGLLHESTLRRRLAVTRVGRRLLVRVEEVRDALGNEIAERVCERLRLRQELMQ